MISDEIYEVISQPQCEGGVFSMGLTYFGHPVACRAALANVAIMEREGLLPHAAKMGSVFQTAGHELKNLPHVADVRGMGLMLAVDLMQDPDTRTPFPVAARVGERVFKACVEAGVIVRPVGDRIILSPPLIIDNTQVEEIFGTLRRVIAAL